MALEEMVFDVMEEFEGARDNIPSMVRTVAGSGLDDALESVSKLLTVVQLIAQKVDTLND